MKYNLDKESFFGIIREISRKRPINWANLNTKDKFFKSFDEIHPAWSSLLSLRDFTDVPGKNIMKRNLFKKFQPLLNFSFYVEYLNSQKVREGVVRKWGSNFIDIWAPFAERNERTLKESNNDWGNVEKLELEEASFIEIENQIGKKLSNEQRESIVASTRDRIQNIFNAHGELYANSVTHGFHKHVTSSKNSRMVSFISHQKNGDIVLFHADLGMSIEKRTETVVDLPAKKRIEWALNVGNSSKDPKENPIRGLGSMFLKSLKAVDTVNDIVGVSGNYSIDFEAKELDEKEIPEDIKMEDKFKIIDKIVVPKITHNQFLFPGTAWFINLKAGNQSYKELQEVMDLIDETKKQDNETVKEYII